MARTRLQPQQVGNITTKVIGTYPDGRPKYQAAAHYGDPEHTGPKSPFKRATGHTVAAAENALRAAVAEVFAARARRQETSARADAAAEAARVPTLRALVERWHKGLDTANVHTRTISDYGYTVAALFGSEYSESFKATTGRTHRAAGPVRAAFAEIENARVPDVTVTDLKVLIAAVARHSGPGAARRVRAVIRAAFHAAVDDGLIPSNTVMQIRYTKSDPLNPARYAPRDDGIDHHRAPDDDEVRELLTALYGDSRALPQVGPRIRGRIPEGGRADGKVNGLDVADPTLLLFTVGLRQAEMLGLTWDRINLADHPRKVTLDVPLIGGKTRRETKTLRPGDLWVTCSLSRITGKGLARGPVKVTAAKRVLPLPEVAVAMLRARAERLHINLDAPLDTAVFGNPTEPARFRDPRNFAKAVERFYSQFGMDWARTHAGRKYTTTRLHRLGWSDDRIMAWCGWSDRNTLATYLDRRQEIPDAMGDALNLDLEPVPQLTA
jgi:integrase